MVGNLKGLELRKRALAAESEVYRETLKLEVHNLHLYGASLQRRLSIFKALGPILLAVAPLAQVLVRRRVESRPSRLGKVVQIWRLYRKLAPVIAAALAGLAGWSRARRG